MSILYRKSIFEKGAVLTWQFEYYIELIYHSQNPLLIFIFSITPSNQTALAKLTGVPPLHGSHVAILIACDAFNARTIDCMGVSLSR